MKQIDRIRNMNAEEMAEMLHKTILGIDCQGCVCEALCMKHCVYSESQNIDCKDIIKAWLLSESEVEDNDA